MKPGSGRTTRAGYGHRHQQVRLRYKRLVERGQAICNRCGQPIHPNEKWDLDHRDGYDKRLGVYAGPAHRSCNRSLTGAAAERRRATTTPAPALRIFDTKTTQ